MTNTHHIPPEIALKEHLLMVQQPARYIGGEYQLKRKYVDNSTLTVGLCFPDLYEIGMSNNAVRILYNLINSIDGVVCERVFTPAPDFEHILRDRKYPLYTLESGIPLYELDILCVTIGYELSATNILTVLECGHIALENDQRSNNQPVVIAGGPAITNPLPFGNFLDAVYLGEAESALPDLLSQIYKMKQEKTKRTEIIEHIHNQDYIWFSGKDKSVRTIDNDFSDKKHSNKFSYFTVPTLRPVQDNGVVEIMRGCPNGCRFCHAGELYKPFRQCDISAVSDAVDQLVNDLGYRNITLSSLSSGDHESLQEIMYYVNSVYSDKRISFSLPSLKVDSFSLSILEQISAVRKSGLTFAIETPILDWQKSINKIVTIDQVIEIILSAKLKGWKLAKFYFMTGLPFIEQDKEIEEITDFLETVQRSTGIQIHVNIGTFIPKPHTAFQWASLMKPREAREHLSALKNNIIANVRKVKVSYHDPDISFIEGMISRGDARVGEIILNAYNKGARLDAWDEYFKKDIWYEVINDQNWNVAEEICSEFAENELLPWDSITLASTTSYLLKEYDKARNRLLTSVCDDICTHNCGVCTKKGNVKPIKADNKSAEEFINERHKHVDKLSSDGKNKVKLLIEYSKKGKAIYISHIQVMSLFEKAMQRAGIQVAFTQGYNPKPILEFAQPLPLGISGEHEFMTMSIYIPDTDNNREKEKIVIKDLISKLNNNLAEGFEIGQVYYFQAHQKVSLTAAYRSSKYTIKGLDNSGLKLIEDLCSSEGLGIIVTKITEIADNNQCRTFSIILKSEVNLMKLISKHMDKYKFLSLYDVKRINLFAENEELYRDYYSAEQIEFEI